VRRQFVVLLMIALLQPLFAMDSKQKSQLDSYLSQRKYSTAIRFLEKVDPQNDDPEALIQKVHISISYFVQSLNHRIFAFKDLTETESVESLRKNGGTFDLGHSIDIPEAVNRLLRKFPNDGRLYSALGDFYADVALRYRQNDPFKDSSKLALEAYQHATSLGSVTEQNQASLGLLAAQSQDYALAEQGYRRALTFDPTNADYNYNLALALMSLSRFQEAQKYAKTAYDRYQIAGSKRDALLMYADSYLYQGHDDEALVYYSQIISAEPDNLFPLRRQMQCYLGLRRIDDLRKAFGNYMRLGGDDPTAVSKLSGIFQSEAYTKTFIDLSDSWIGVTSPKASGKTLLSLGTLSYYEAFAFKAVGDQSKYRKRLTEAKDYLASVLSPDNPIFKQIDQDLAK